jgi:hypothetical protein
LYYSVVIIGTYAMLEKLLTSPLHYIGSLIASAVLCGLMYWITGKSKPSELGLEHGTILPDKRIATAAVAIGTFVFAVAANAAVFGNGGGGAAVIALAFFAMTGFMVPAMTDIHAVHWDKNGIEGPSKLFFAAQGLARTRIPWEKIVTGGETFTDYYFIESEGGHRIYWNRVYRGHGYLLKAVVAKCPHLFEEELV